MVRLEHWRASVMLSTRTPSQAFACQPLGGGVSPSLGAEYKKRKPSVIQITSFFVRMVRLELTQANAHYPLKVACLPFHHIRR